MLTARWQSAGLDSARRLALPLVLTVTLAGFAPAVAETPGDYVAETLVAGDLDGDGVEDAVTLSHFEQPYTEVGPLGVSAEPERRAVVSAHSGRDGHLLWSTTVDDHTPNQIRIEAAQLGAQGRPGVLLLSGSLDDDLRNANWGQTGVAYYGVKEQSLPAHVTGIGADGSVAFDLRYGEDQVGVAAHAEQLLLGGVDDAGAVEGRVSVLHSVIHGTGQFTGDAATDVLVSVTNKVQAGPAGASDVQVLAIDGATGEQREILRHLAPSPTRVALPFADLDGDGLDDLLLRQPSPVVGLAAVSSADGSVLWEQPDVRGDHFVYTMPAGDLTGDGTPDVLVTRFETLWETLPQGWWVIDGTDGGILHQLEDHALFPYADVDGDGAMDLAKIPVRETDYAVEVIAADGTVLRPAVPVTREDGFPMVAGDLDGDGQADVLTQRVRVSHDRLYEIATTRLLGDPLVRAPGGGYPIHDSLDGVGDDLLAEATRDGDRVQVSALDGADLAPLLTASFPTPSDAPGETLVLPLGVADLTGDGIPDLLLDVDDSTRRAVTAVDGASGDWLWTTN